MEDLQNYLDTRNITIDKVGIKDLKYPIILKDKVKGQQHTIAKINMYVQLPDKFKGTHMSRFIEILNQFRENMTIESIKKILSEMKGKLHSLSAHFDMTFTYFVEKKAPISQTRSLMDYECQYIASDNNNQRDFVISVKIPVLSLCPCSKEISDYGAHNQRSIVKISLRHTRMIWIEDIIDLAEKSSSAPIYSLLKREDEKFITEKAYNNPAFVEDIVRNIAVQLLKEDRVNWFEVSSENYESIHNHSVYAVVCRQKN
jgi:GTP cyclohydrolase I